MYAPLEVSTCPFIDLHPPGLPIGHGHTIIPYWPAANIYDICHASTAQLQISTAVGSDLRRTR